MEFDPIESGKCVKKLRTQKGITQETLGKKLHISKKLISDIECGRRKITPYELVPLAEYFGVSTDYLLCGCALSSSDVIYLQDMLDKAENHLLAARKYIENHK